MMGKQIENAKADYHFWSKKFEKDQSYYHKSQMTASKKLYDQLMMEWCAKTVLKEYKSKLEKL